MSSHHIVRDEQEPALLIINPNLNNVPMDSLLEWTPTVIVDARDVEKLLLQGFKLDVVIGGNKDLELIRELLTHQEPLKYLTKNKEENTLERALHFLLANNYNAVNIIGKWDSAFTKKLNPFTSKIDLVIYDNNLKWHYSKEHFKKWLSIGQSIVLWDEVDEIIFNNYQVATENNKFMPTQEGFIEISNQTGFWLGERI